MSKLEVDKLTPQSGTSLTLGDNGDTFTLPSGTILTATSATVNLPATQTVTTELKTNKISPASGTSFTFGDSGDTFTVPSGATITNNGTATGFGGNTDPFRNIIINGDMSLAQRGTSTSGVTTTDGYYACDRWYTQTDTGTWTISQSTDVPTGQGFANSLKLDCTSAGTANSDEVGIRNKIEGQFLQNLKYGTSSAESITLSFWIKSNKTGTYTVAIVNDNSSQTRLVSINYTISSANTWEKKTITFPGDTSRAIDNTNGEEFVLYWWFSAASSFRSGGVQNTWTNYDVSYFADTNLAGLGGSTDDEVYITGVQLEVGTLATDFAFVPYDVNFRRCQRYYSRTTSLSGLTGHNFFVGYNSNEAPGSLVFPVTMRAAPTVTLYNSGGTSGGTHRFGVGDLTGVSLSRVSEVGYGTLNKTGGLVAGAYYIGMWEADAEL